MNIFQKEDVISLVESAKLLFLENDSSLLDVSANERSMTHKFAEHLQALLKERGSYLVVDCEYNRYGEGPKYIPSMKSIVGDKVDTKSTKARTVYPDIIIHERGVSGLNLLVIEAKKDATHSNKKDDMKKLRLLKGNFDYSYALFLNFDTKNKNIKFELCL